MDLDLYKPVRGQPARGKSRRLRMPGLAQSLGIAAGALLLAGSLATALSGPIGRPLALAWKGEEAAARQQPDPMTTATVDPSRLADAAPTIFRGGPNGIELDSTVAIPGSGDGTATPVTFHVEDPGDFRQSGRSTTSPEADLVEESPFGPLPRRAQDGRAPADVYSVEASMRPGPRIALIVGGLGISQSGSQRAIETLPAAVTLGFAASGNSLGRWMRQARQGGHELVLQIPLAEEADSGASRDRGTPLVSRDAVRGRFDDLYAALGSMTNYAGVMNYGGAGFLSSEPAVEPLISELDRRGLFFVDDSGTRASRTRAVASKLGSPMAVTDLRLDSARSEAAIRDSLDRLEQIARDRGTAVGVASAFGTSIDTIAAWARQAAGRGLQIVPVSALTRNETASL